MIIDIGSGFKPYKYADVLLEKYDVSNQERWGKDILVDRPIVFYSGNKFPFKNCSFDYSVCRHVLEHVEDPEIFLDEIMRVSSAGYIETPSEISELVFTPFKYHKWIIDLKDNTLLIKKKNDQNVSKLGKLFDYLCENEEGFEEYFYKKRKKLFLTRYEWKESIKYKIMPESEKTYNDYFDEVILNEKTKIVDDGALYLRHQKNDIKDVFSKIEKIIHSPCCDSFMKMNENTVDCLKCGKDYKREGNKILLTHD